MHSAPNAGEQHLLAIGFALFTAILSLALNLAWSRFFIRRFWASAGAILALWTAASLDPHIADVLRIAEWLPQVHWVRAAGLLWTATAAAMLLGRTLWQRSTSLIRPRREFLRTAACGIVAGPFLATGYGRFNAGRDPAVREVTLGIPDLDPDLEGLKIVQLSDLHLSSFLSRDQVRRAVDMANDLKGDLALITGDLITSPGDPLDDCLTELRRLRSTAGVYGCLGNHEIVAAAEDYTTATGARLGIRFLRSQAETLRFGAGLVNLAGVDYQRRSHPYLVDSRKLRCDHSLNILMSHNPDVFPTSTKQGWDLVLAGHTHGGQVTLEYLHPTLNPARFYTPFVYGTYSIARSRMYVTSGIGTVGVPLRINTLPEVALIRLARA